MLIAGSGEEALEQLAGAAQDVDVVLCDLMMPGLSGMAVYEQVAASAPALAARFVFMTGGAFTPGAEAFLEQVPCPVLYKPTPLDALEAVIQEVGGDAARDLAARGAS